jgi:putative transposase
MPWKECPTVDLRKQFVLAAMAPGANVSALCREYGISRTNGYKWLARFKEQGAAGLDSRSRRPRRSASVDGETVIRLLELSNRYRWGPKKLRQLLINEYGSDKVPSVKTVGRILERAGQPKVRPPRRRSRVVFRQREALVVAAPNDVWTVDFKGWWRTRDGKRFDPLTVRDDFSRFVLCLQMLGSQRSQTVKEEFEALFERHGLPKVIRVDNGAPFACTSAPCGLSRLSSWWISLGIRVSFSRPAHPQDNGRHERMHADVAADLEADASDSLATQQAAADEWRALFNQVRPHEAIGMRRPTDLYCRSPRPFLGSKNPQYPSNFARRFVGRKGCVRYAGKNLFISEALFGHMIGIRRNGNRFVTVRFYDLKLGNFDLLAAPPTRPPRLLSKPKTLLIDRAA